jgi:hypothetical protein
MFTVLIIFEVDHNFYGQHIGNVDLDHLTNFVKGLYAGAILYPISLTFSKLSLLALYWRIFRQSTGRIPIIIAAGLNLAWMTAAVSDHQHSKFDNLHRTNLTFIIQTLVGIFICTPIRGFWDPMVKSHCVDYPVFFISNEAFTIALDVVVLLMPVYFLSSIKRSLSQRISISSTFVLGLM